MAKNINICFALMWITLFGHFGQGYSDLQIFFTKKITYGQDYLYVQFRSVQTSTAVTVNKLIVQRNNTATFVDILETDFNSTVWKDSKMQERSCSETWNGVCANVTDIHISKDNVNCADTGTYRGILELSDGSNLTEQAHLEVKVVPDRIEPIELVSGQNDSLPFHVHSKLVLLCTGGVGDPPMNIHWCIKRSTDVFPKLYDIQEDISNGIPYLVGCQYIQTSNITYVVSNKDSHTLLRCYAGDFDQCNNNLIPYGEFLVRKGSTSAGNNIGMKNLSFLQFLFLVKLSGLYRLVDT
ncbi:unnamed protein product [Mytilus coruscus]|uniref:Ig-like domain-containing protein n=1 Tax=Mytilus coruscus TaxID=42192 RepID=A0A6J8CFF0_MYTCO|nr:unnamed protein product [Mytilus coruscus]